MDGAYPLYRRGRARSAEAAARRVLARRGGAFGAVADPALLDAARSRARRGIKLGHATIELRAALTSEPDKLAGGIGFGPRLLISQAALRATGLMQPGSLVRWTTGCSCRRARARPT